MTSMFLPWALSSTSNQFLTPAKPMKLFLQESAGNDQLTPETSTGYVTLICLFAQSLSSIEKFKLLVKRNLSSQPFQDILLHR
jgi:hypothetical protein